MGLHADISIAPLASNPEVIAQLARWHWAEGQKLRREIDVRGRLIKLLAHLGDTPVPQTFIALERGKLVGAASLISHTQRLDPADPLYWLANVYVGEAFRRRGIATQLIQRVQDYARDLGLAELYLFTTDQREFYLRRHWRWLRSGRMRGRVIDILTFDLRDVHALDRFGYSPRSN
ncbi:MAG: GNAT family N-acetyltransferase [Exilibacterium sp.]